MHRHLSRREGISHTKMRVMGRLMRSAGKGKRGGGLSGEGGGDGREPPGPDDDAALSGDGDAVARPLAAHGRDGSGAWGGGRNADGESESVCVAVNTRLVCGI